MAGVWKEDTQKVIFINLVLEVNVQTFVEANGYLMTPNRVGLSSKTARLYGFTSRLLVSKI